MFVTIKDENGKKYVCPIGAVVIATEGYKYCAKIQYANENIMIDKDEYNRIKFLKDKEDSLLMDTSIKTKIQYEEA